MDLKIPELEQEIKQYRRSTQRLTVRLIVLLELAKVQLRRPLRDGDYRLVGSRYEKTARTLYNWKKLYDKGGAKKLNPHKAPGKKPEPIRGWTAKIIKEMRLQFNWGAEVICAHLREYHQIKLSEGRVLRFLKRTGLLKTKRKTTKINYHTKIVKVFDPGAHTQMDVKYLPHLLGEKKKCYDHIGPATLCCSNEFCIICRSHIAIATFTNFGLVRRKRCSEDLLHTNVVKIS